MKIGGYKFTFIDTAGLRKHRNKIEEIGIENLPEEYKEIAQALDSSICSIEDAIMQALAMTPPELAADIYNTGIYLAGGGSMLRGLEKRISAKTDLAVFIAEDPLKAVVRGTGIALKNVDHYTFLMR